MGVDAWHTPGSDAGEYFFRPTSGTVTNAGYSPLSKNQGTTAGTGSFETFCLERSEGVRSPSEYTINDEALNGGINNTPPAGDQGGDVISQGTAWLYSQFAQGTLPGYDFTNAVNRTNSAELLQFAIWVLEDELGAPAGANNPFYQLALQHGGKANAPAGLHGVYVLNNIGNSPQQLGQMGQDCLYFALVGTVGDFVWHDLDGDGIQDAGEPGINGVTVKLYDSTGTTLLATTVTANNGTNDGYYQFSGLFDGTYKVVVDGTTVPPTLTPTTVPGSSNGNDGAGNDSNNPNGTTVTLGEAQGRDIQTIDFGYESPCTGSIGDFVWHDTNNNGCQDSGEPGIMNVQVDLYAGCGGNGSPIQTIFTDVNGKYQFIGLCAGTYTVSFHTPAGYTRAKSNQGCQTGSTPSDELDSDCDCQTGQACGICVTLPAINSTDLSIDCGYVPLGTVGDFVWVDVDGDGLQDAGEPGINGVTVKLYDSTGMNLLATTVTANNGTNDGYYQFSNLPDGTYKVVVDGTTIPAGLTQTTVPGGSNGNDGVGNDSNNPGGTSVTLGDLQGRDIQTIDFGYKFVCTGKIGDFVWNDLNGNGCQDPGEPGIPGVTVNLSTGCAPNTVTFIKTTTTDSNGKYLFTDLCAGQYTVSFITPNGFTRTLANQACNVGGKPADETDSDCDCVAGGDCGICVSLPAYNSEDLTIDCGYTGNTPCVELTKSAASATALPGSQMTYTYLLHNCGSTLFNDLAIIDDNGTPADFTDDFTVASGISLAPNESKTFTATVILPIPLCAGTGSPPASAGSLDVTVLPSGDFKVVLTQARTLNDNAYGTSAPAAGWGGNSHTFNQLVGSDKAEFRFTNGAGAVVLDFYLDYISAATSKTFPNGTIAYPSGYGTLGANGGDGSLVAGNIAHVLTATTSLTENLNSPLNGCCPSPYLVNSPTPEAAHPDWNYLNTYTVVVSKAAFGASGFGGVTIPDIHNSPAKTGTNQVAPTPCGDCITNTASVVTVTGTAPNQIIGATLATDTATVCLGTPIPPTPPCLITPGALKIDKKTVQLPLKNNGTTDIFLSEVNVTWNQAVNGNLVKMSLNGDIWTGSVASGTVVNSGFHSDANRRKIAKGQTKTLVLTFVNNASKTVGDYSGTIKFGSDASCAIAFPPPAPPAPFDCDGHIQELKMKWNGTQPVKIVAHYGGTAATAVLTTIDNVAVGQVVTVGSYAGSPNDVIWEIFNAGTNTKIGESQFHTSCSDSTMDGPEDCGSAQGNGKSNLATVNGWATINTWQFAGLTTIKGTKLTCP